MPRPNHFVRPAPTHPLARLAAFVGLAVTGTLVVPGLPAKAQPAGPEITPIVVSPTTVTEGGSFEVTGAGCPADGWPEADWRVYVANFRGEPHPAIVELPVEGPRVTGVGINASAPLGQAATEVVPRDDGTWVAQLTLPLGSPGHYHVGAMCYSGWKEDGMISYATVPLEVTAIPTTTTTTASGPPSRPDTVAPIPITQPRFTG